MVLSFVKAFDLLADILTFHSVAGFNIPSLRAASVLNHFNIGAPHLKSYETIRLSLLQNGTSTWFTIFTIGSMCLGS